MHAIDPVKEVMAIEGHAALSRRMDSRDSQIGQWKRGLFRYDKKSYRLDSVQSTVTLQTIPVALGKLFQARRPMALVVQSVTSATAASRHTRAV